MTAVEGIDFVAVDVETANYWRGSICQIGVVTVRDGRVSEMFETLVDPEVPFDPYHTAIHGISEADVADAPRLPAVMPKVRELLADRIVASHTSFDKSAFGQALASYDEPPLEAFWLDTACVARRAWKDEDGYGLTVVAERLGIDVRHHHAALADARMCAEVLLAAVEEKQRSPEGWLRRVAKPIRPRASAADHRPAADHRRVGDVDGEYHGESICFTGRLPMTRQEAADMASAVGFDVHANVTKKTTFLVVGMLHSACIVGKKSRKQRIAEKWATKGTGIQVITGADFLAMIPGEYEMPTPSPVPDSTYNRATEDPMFYRRAVVDDIVDSATAEDLQDVWTEGHWEVELAVDFSGEAPGPDPWELAWSEEHDIPLMGMTMLCAWALKALVVLHERGQTPATSAEVSACAEDVAKPGWGPSMETSSFTARLKVVENEGLATAEKRSGKLYWTPTSKALEAMDGSGP